MSRGRADPPASRLRPRCRVSCAAARNPPTRSQNEQHKRLLGGAVSARPLRGGVQPMQGKEQKGSSYVELSYRSPRLGRAAPEPYDDEMVTIVVPRRLAEDLYYALAIALGS